MRYLVAVLFTAASIWPQSVRQTLIPAGPGVVPAATDGKGGIWAAGLNRVIRLDAEGKTVFDVTLDATADVAVRALTVDAAGNAVLALSGQAGSTLTWLDGAGSVVRSVPVTGSVSALAIDSAGSVFAAGSAAEGFVATAGAYKTAFGEKACSDKGGNLFACSDAFLIKVRANGAVEWATLFGGTQADYATSLAVDRQGEIWVAGETRSENMPVTPGAPQRAYGGGETLGPLAYGDGFVARISTDGSTLRFSTYLGGTRFDRVNTMTAIDGGVVLGGVTESPNFPVTSGALQTKLANTNLDMPGMHTDSFVAVLAGTGELTYSTYYGDGLGPRSASASGRGPGNSVGVQAAGGAKRCLITVEVAERTTVRPACFVSAFEDPFTPLYGRDAWIAVSATLRGLPIPSVNPTSLISVIPFGGDNPGVGIASVWGDLYPAFRPVLTPDSYISVYLPVTTNLANAGVQLGNVPLRVIYAGNNQINAYVPADVPVGASALRVVFPFFTSIPIAVDVAERWPGLAPVLLNQDGTLNTEANPAARGSVIQMFGTAFGATPLPVIEPFIVSTGVSTAQGMELLFAGKVGDGLFQINARVPANAVTGAAPARIVMRLPGGFLSSNLIRVWVR